MSSGGSSPSRYVVATYFLNRRENTCQVLYRWTTVQLSGEHVLNECIGLRAVTANSVCFYTTVAICLALNDQCIGDCTVVTFVDINRIIVYIDSYIVIHIDRSAKKLEAIVISGISLSITNRRSASNAGESYTV